MMGICKAPFSDEQIKELNDRQKDGMSHPYTCCSPDNIPVCMKATREIDGIIVKGTSDGILTPTKEGWICPCGKYKQDWYYI